MLGIMPHIVRNMRAGRTTITIFVTLTSGFTAVTNHYMLAQLECLNNWIDSEVFQDLYRETYFELENEEGRNRDVWQYLDGIAAMNEDMRAEGTARRMLRNLMELYDERQPERPSATAWTELDHYFRSVYPGQQGSRYGPEAQRACAESGKRKHYWGYFGWQCSNIRQSSPRLLHG